MENPLPISVCIIAGNEAHRIGNALKSVHGWVSEIIVVLNDTVSDGTDQIAAKFGAKVFRESWKGHIAQKNSAAQKAAQPWILGLDADEEISPALRDEIRQLFFGAQPAPSFAAFNFPRCTLYCGRWIRHGDWYPDRKTRLWRSGTAVWGGIDPHDKLVVQGTVGKLKSDMLHYSNESIAHQVAKIIPYQSGFLQQRLAAGKPAGFFELAVRPPWRFVRAYFFRLGFLDGWQGYYIAGISAFSALTRYTLLRAAKAEQKHS
ncbi:MAG TPA: glycosyltransferase family 2 protein [Verrucomicrobiae bacterium]